jgi:hypothetical protein
MPSFGEVVAVPVALPQLCTGKVLTMSYLDGPKLEEEARRQLLSIGVDVSSGSVSGMSALLLPFDGLLVAQLPLHVEHILNILTKTAGCRLLGAGYCVDMIKQSAKAAVSMGGGDAGGGGSSSSSGGAASSQISASGGSPGWFGWVGRLALRGQKTRLLCAISLQK